MGEREDGLGLTLGLSLKFPDQNLPPPLPFNLHFIFQTPKLSSLIDAFQSSPDARSNLRGIDVNRRPSTATECEDEVGMSSPNSTISSVSGKREENGTERGWTTGCGCRCGGEEEDDDGGDTAERKKLRLSKEQSALLEETFKAFSTLKPKQKVSLANQLNLRTRQVEVWFQNRRARTKLKQTEVDCEYLKRCYENLTEENRRLQKEANELRALKLSPQTYMHMNPPTTLTMCPSCERVAVLPPPSSAAASTTAPAAAAIGITRHLMPERSTPGIAWPFKFNSNNSQAA